MLKKNIKEFKLNNFKEFGDRWALLTAGDKSVGFNTLTVSWGGTGVLWGKNVGFVFVRKSRHTYNFLEKSKSVTLSFLPNELKEKVAIIGKVSGRDCNKMELTNLHYTYDPDYDGAYIEESNYVFKMKKLFSIDLGKENMPEEIINKFYLNDDSHVMYVCEITQYLVKEDLYELY